MAAKVILDSISPLGHRLTTMEVTFHRFVLAEFNTHRQFSRNSASSRAIPLEKMLARLQTEETQPLSWPAEQPGMQGGATLEGADLDDAIALWEDIRDYTRYRIEDYISAHPEKSKRVHKSVINRLLEPFLQHTVIVSSTEWDNFFAQRCSPLAQPEIRVVAEQMREALNASTPTEVGFGEWHTPYVYETDLSESERRMVSVARCARVSYLTHDGVPNVDKDLKLYEKLVGANPPHYSPLEHVATPADVGETVPGNFEGWHQLRHLV